MVYFVVGIVFDVCFLVNEVGFEFFVVDGIGWVEDGVGGVVCIFICYYDVFYEWFVDFCWIVVVYVFYVFFFEVVECC